MLKYTLKKIKLLRDHLRQWQVANNKKTPIKELPSNSSSKKTNLMNSLLDIINRSLQINAIIKSKSILKKDELIKLFNKKLSKKKIIEKDPAKNKQEYFKNNPKSILRNYTLMSTETEKRIQKFRQKKAWKKERFPDFFRNKHYEIIKRRRHKVTKKPVFTFQNYNKNNVSHQKYQKKLTRRRLLFGTIFPSKTDKKKLNREKISNKFEKYYLRDTLYRLQMRNDIKNLKKNHAGPFTVTTYERVRRWVNKFKIRYMDILEKSFDKWGNNVYNQKAVARDLRKKQFHFTRYKDKFFFATMAAYIYERWGRIFIRNFRKSILM